MKPKAGLAINGQIRSHEKSWPSYSTRPERDIAPASLSARLDASLYRNAGSFVEKVRPPNWPERTRADHGTIHEYYSILALGLSSSARRGFNDIAGALVSPRTPVVC